MEVNGIVVSPDPRLREECARIEEITPEIVELAHHMADEMLANGGVGIAAPQVGQLVQLVVIDVDYNSEEDYDPYYLINPVIIEQSESTQTYNEGCLSIPGISVPIARPDHVVVEAYDLEGNLMRYDATGDLMCVCLQHEIDHLHGITMFERLDPLKRIHAMHDYQEALKQGVKPGDTSAE